MLELQFDKFSTSASFLVWKTRFKTQVSNGSDFPSETMLRIKEEEMVDSSDELKSPRPVSDWKEFSKCWDAGREDCLGAEQNHPEFPVQKEGQPRGSECTTPKKDRFLRGRLIAFMIYDYLLALTTQYQIMLFIFCHSVLITFRNSQRDGTKFYYVNNSIRWNLGKSIQI